MKTKEEWLNDMELRLKRALLDVLDSSEEEGHRFLRAEIASHLEDIPGDRIRFEYLVGLRERFPQLLGSGGSNDSINLECSAPASLSVEDALELVSREWDTLDERTRTAFLEAKGFSRTVADVAPEAEPEVAPESEPPVVPEVEPEVVPEARPEIPRKIRTEVLGEPSDDLVRFLKLADEAPIDFERLQTACVSLLKTVAQVDSLATQVYKQVGLSRDLKAEDLRKLIGEFVSGRPVEVDRINGTLDESRMKVGLIISSVANLPSTLAQSHFAKFQPAAIERAVGGGGSLLSGKDAKCWKKYVALADDLQPHNVEKAVSDLMIRQLKKLKTR